MYNLHCHSLHKDKVENQGGEPCRWNDVGFAQSVTLGTQGHSQYSTLIIFSIHHHVLLWLQVNLLRKFLGVPRFWAGGTAITPPPLHKTQWLLSQGILDQPERWPGGCPRLREWFYFKICWDEHYLDPLIETPKDYRGHFRTAPLFWEFSSKISEDCLLCEDCF